MVAFTNFICVSKCLSVYGVEAAIELYKNLKKMRQRFAPCFCFAHFKNQTARKTDNELGFIAQHKLNQIKCCNIQTTAPRILNSFHPTSHIVLELKHSYFLVFSLLFVLMIQVHNNSMVRPSIFDFLKTIIFSEKMKL